MVLVVLIILGAGIIVDSELGYVVVDKETVPNSVGNATIVFSGSIEVSANIVFVHPLFNFSIISYDPKIVSDIPVRNIDIDTSSFDVGEKCNLVVLNEQGRTVLANACVTQMEPLTIPEAARFRDTCTEAINIVSHFLYLL